MKRVFIPWLVVCFALLTILNVSAQNQREMLKFEENETLEEIRIKIELNGYDFKVGHNRIFDMTPEQKKAFFNRKKPAVVKEAAPDEDIGPLAAHLGRALPASFDWRNYNGHSYIGDVSDQGNCGACYAFSAAAAAEGAWNFTNGHYDSKCLNLSEAFIAFCLSEYYDGFGGCDGASYDYEELAAIVRFGLPLETAFPYKDTLTTCLTSAWNAPRVHFKSWHRVPCGDVDAIKTDIMTYGVVDAAVDVVAAFQAYESGVYDDTSTDCPANPCYYTETNHAIALVGWDDDGDAENRGYWILRNSWGNSWGENGYMRIRYRAARVSCAVSYLVAEQVPTPTPTPVYEPGDNCLKPIAAAEGVYKGDTTNLHNFYDPSRSPIWRETWSLAGPECVYKVNIPDPRTIDALYVKVASASFDNAIYVMRDCSNPSGSLLAYADDYSDKTGEMLTWKPDKAGDVYVVVDSYNPNIFGAFMLQISLSGDVPLPTPTATPTPTSPPPTPTPFPDLKNEEFIYEFVTTDNYAEGWKPTTVSIFSLPRFIITPGKIGFSANGSPNCYGSWESPYHKFTKGQTYKASFKVWSSIKDPKKVPSFRFRAEDSTFQTIATLNVNSHGTAESSPTDTVSQTYELIYRPSNSALANGYHLTFDLVNFGTEDDPNAQIMLDSVEIKKVSVYP